MRPAIIATGWRRCASSRSTPCLSQKRRSSISRTSPARARWTGYTRSITNRYTFKLTIDGEEQELTRGELMVLRAPGRPRPARPGLPGAVPRLRQRCAHPRADLPDPGARLAQRERRTAQFSSPISARNLVNDIPDEVVNTLLDVCERNSGVFQRYFQLKARWIGMERLRRYDIYAPVAKADKQYAFRHRREDGARHLQRV